MGQAGFQKRESPGRWPVPEQEKRAEASPGGQASGNARNLQSPAPNNEKEAATPVERARPLKPGIKKIEQPEATPPQAAEAAAANGPPQGQSRGTGKRPMRRRRVRMRPKGKGGGKGKLKGKFQ